MKEVVEALLRDVDADIKDLMLKDCEDEEIPTTTMTISSTGSLGTEKLKNWETLPDPLFFIIKWQELRNKKNS